MLIFILFVYIGYKVTFKDTFLLSNEINEKQTKIEWLKSKEAEIPAIQKKLNDFEKNYSNSDTTIAVRDKLTAYISLFASQNGCIVTEIPTRSSYKSNNLKVQTNTFTIQGSFKVLLQLLNSLESKHKYLARIMSANFYTITDIQNKRKNLYLTLITQSFQK
jgi:uncharacterized coiled-coil DUF342 family protein